MRLTTAAPTTIRDLAAQGFDDREINNLRALKAGYDHFREFCESNSEFERLSFLKWRYENGSLGSV